MRKSDFSYELPERLIAQDPLSRRSDSRLLVMDRKTGQLTHRHFTDLLEYLNPGDCLVLNDTKVLPARLIGERVLGGEQVLSEGQVLGGEHALDREGIIGGKRLLSGERGGRVELLLLKEHPKPSEPRVSFGPSLNFKCYETLVKPGKRCVVGSELSFGDGLIKARVVKVLADGNRLIEFSYRGIWEEVLAGVGQMPLPPYITHSLEDQDRYQTVYAKVTGSAAAPTAGLHFTTELLERARTKGIQIVSVTLHVGLGTFRPVKEEYIRDHHMHTELYRISQDAAEQINQCRLTGHRVICVGTTSCRTLESAAFYNPEQRCWALRAQSADTDIFLYPG
ncbi:MAG: S-adenosylmethionine:tRNA ribosyltransferase-isomerase, partial [Clostridium sp.]|nr:S-adenosylmethionine:tRNA ribosyltransferase-isomerase [Clostridium sp.]